MPKKNRKKKREAKKGLLVDPVVNLPYLGNFFGGIEMSGKGREYIAAKRAEMGLPEEGAYVTAFTPPSMEYDRPAQKVEGTLTTYYVNTLDYIQCFVTCEYVPEGFPESVVQVDPETVREIGEEDEVNTDLPQSAMNDEHKQEQSSQVTTKRKRSPHAKRETKAKPARKQTTIPKKKGN